MSDDAPQPLNIPDKTASPVITDELRKATLLAARSETERQMEGKALGRKAQERGISR